MSRLPRAAALAVGLLAAAGARAAGGHHAVDDAALLAPGACKLEGWATRADDRARLTRAGLGCRIGPMELTAAGERERSDGASATTNGVGAKWARELDGGWSVGAALSTSWRAGARPREQTSVTVALVTWQPHEAVQLHANLGRELVRQGPDLPHGGIAVAWSPSSDWQLVGERYSEVGGRFARLALRWEPVADWTLDVSRSVRLRGDGASAWTLGVTRVLSR